MSLHALKAAGRPLFLLLVLLLLTLVACGPGGSKEDEHSGHGEHSGDSHGGAEEHGEDAETLLHLEGLRGVSFREAGPPRQESAYFAALAVSDPSAETQLAIPLAGQVVAFRVQPGQKVAKGEAVLELRSPELADLEARYQAAQVREGRAARELAREERLLAQQATSLRELEAATSEVALAQAEASAAASALRARGAEPGSGREVVAVRALRAGVLVEYTVALGENVAAGTQLGTLVTPGAALVRVDLAQPGPQVWAPGAPTEVRRADGQTWAARVEGIPPRLSPDTRRLSYWLRLEGESLPLAGTPLEVRVPLAKAIVLPQTALQQIEGVWGVFVRSGEEAEFRPVRKGAELGADVLVLEGLVASDFVATEGAYLLKALQLKLAGGGESHDH